MTDPVRLGDYATDDGLYFATQSPTQHYVTSGNGMSAGDVGARRFDTDEFLWMDADTEVFPRKTPPRPLPPVDDFISCSDATRDELRRSLRGYRRQMEAYADALEKQVNESGQ